MPILPLNLAVVWGLFSLTGLAMLSGVWMWTFRTWLTHRSPTAVPEDKPGAASSLPYAGMRIDLADLRERIRRLEAIAAGIDMA